MEQHANLSNQSGFTLIEFCIAVVIMMVGLLGLLQAVNYATVVNLGTTLRNEAVYLADEQLVPVKTFAFERVTSSSYLVNRKTRGGFNNYSVVRTVTSPSTMAWQARRLPDLANFFLSRSVSSCEGAERFPVPSSTSTSASSRTPVSA